MTSWDQAGLKTVEEETVMKRIERKFSGHRDALAGLIGRQTFTGKRRGTGKALKQSAELGKVVTRGDSGDGSVLKKGKVRKWAGTRKRKGETKKSSAAKDLLDELFDIALPDSEQNEEALVYLRDARGKRELRLPTPKAREVKASAEAESGGGGDELVHFQTVGQLMNDII